MIFRYRKIIFGKFPLLCVTNHPINGRRVFRIIVLIIYVMYFIYDNKIIKYLFVNFYLFTIIFIYNLYIIRLVFIYVHAYGITKMKIFLKCFYCFTKNYSTKLYIIYNILRQ